VSNENLIIRYYGITDWLTNLNEAGIIVQSIVVQVTAKTWDPRSAIQPGELHPPDQWAGLQSQRDSIQRSLGLKNYSSGIAGLYQHLSLQQTGCSGLRLQYSSPVVIDLKRTLCR